MIWFVVWKTIMFHLDQVKKIHSLIPVFIQLRFCRGLIQKKIWTKLNGSINKLDCYEIPDRRPA